MLVMNSFEIIRIFFEESTTSISDIVTHDTINLAVTDFAAPERMNRPPHALSIDEQCRLFAVLRDWLPYPKASGLNHLVRTLESRCASVPLDALVTETNPARFEPVVAEEHVKARVKQLHIADH
ncbi:hypothetical protein CNMCM8980_006892 [Aspergillus fumigatiaffinis]|uniref:Uncharacterized protein n=1 Tax=Aspergillus fumigatiaffinis TaxID=340414 RepID=A0A8H4M5I4_9EURO|nr:hypothetical protein CNMCM5878_009541 [Aspergillus fumigatiaffinis]KAF4230564.1 hypothetical protein CNMCM6457_005909 [Aspergillus fumigatiaffinis]KAF4237762.1 hypothetical protein CNMCM6805_006819 [Aspergillus fumigatiaffinis]KAF4247824.1 hypothetical protein CNMCM8980_006892 [Aspergillus fumigatiaffinis]